MGSWFDIVCLLGLICVNGVFAMSEIALVTSRRARLQVLSDDGNKGAAKAMQLQNDPTWALSTIQVGITSIGVLSGIVGQSALAEPIAGFLMEFGLGAETAKAAGIVTVVVAVTYFSIVLGELVPKRLGQGNPERLACIVAGPLRGLSLIMSPFVKLLSVSTEVVLKVLGADKNKEASVTEEEIHAMIEEGSESGVIESTERDMVRNVFRLDDRQVGSVMTPRSDIEWIDLDDSLELNIQKVLTSNRSRMIVASGSLDDVKGCCTTRQLLQQIVENGQLNLLNNLAPAAYVPESLTGMELLEHFKNTDTPLALVVDEYGEVVGLVTPRDLLEAIAGEFKPKTTDDAWAVQRPDGSYFLDGIIPVPELKDQLHLREVPQEELGRYNTLSGMMMLLLQRLPRTGDVVQWEGWKFEVADMDGRRIDKVLATRIGLNAEDMPTS
ncbi:MAG: HlyC/CorC family transporter [Duodenibacillus sp.]|nr:HlyC/CorC family transporter [Duodenibacillus sp.]